MFQNRYFSNFARQLAKDRISMLKLKRGGKDEEEKVPSLGLYSNFGILFVYLLFSLKTASVIFFIELTCVAILRKLSKMLRQRYQLIVAKIRNGVNNVTVACSKIGERFRDCWNYLIFHDYWNYLSSRDFWNYFGKL